MLRSIEAVGEACHRIEVRYPDFAMKNPAVPFARACQRRNALAHGYSDIDLDIAWLTIVNDLPAFGRALEQALRADGLVS